MDMGKDSSAKGTIERGPESAGTRPGEWLRQEPRTSDPGYRSNRSVDPRGWSGTAGGMATSEAAGCEGGVETTARVSNSRERTR
jgi:hypothetical protein